MEPRDVAVIATAKEIPSVRPFSRSRLWPANLLYRGIVPPRSTTAVSSRRPTRDLTAGADPAATAILLPVVPDRRRPTKGRFGGRRQGVEGRQRDDAGGLLGQRRVTGHEGVGVEQRRERLRADEARGHEPVRLVER